MCKIGPYNVDIAGFRWDIPVVYLQWLMEV